MHPSADPERCELFGPEALRLAPRARGLPWADAGERLVQVSCRRAALPAAAKRELAALALAAADEHPTRSSWLLHPSALESLAASPSPGALLASAARAALAPPPRPRIVGVLNVTPDSFSDGGLHLDPKLAVERARGMIAEGADWIDVGGESTRPGAAPVPAATELERVLPVLRELNGEGDVELSIDTTKAEVAAAALDAGAQTINDVSAGRFDAQLLSLAANRDSGLVLMHMAGTPRDMQDAPGYVDVVDEVCEHLRARAAAALEAGVAPARLWLDPGIGFGKDLGHNLELLARLGELRSLGLPLFLGVSRKSFIGQVNALRGRTGELASSRIGGTAAAVAACVEAGAAALRVHDVAVMAEAAHVAHARVRALLGL